LPANPLIFARRATRRTGRHHHREVRRADQVAPDPGSIADSLSSSHFALELKRLGIDGLVITGQAPSLAYLYINRHTSR